MDIDLYKYFKIERPNNAECNLRCYLLATSREVSLERKSPAVLVIPGGGYSMVSEREGEPVALAYVARGFNAFVLHYTCAPARFPTQIREAAMAMIFIRKNADVLHVRPDRVAAVGFSAGGHLCASLGILFRDVSLSVFEADTMLIRPDAMVLGYPVITATKYAHQGSFDNLCGDDQVSRTALSLEKRVTAHSTPAFIFATCSDTGVSAMNSLKIAEAYATRGVPFSLHIFERGCHGLSLGDYTCNSYGCSAVKEMSRDYALWQHLSVDWLIERDFVPQD